jgi:hypothetical protein
MQVSSYTFQSPYPQPVQMGRADPAMVQEQQKATQEQADKARETAVGLVGAQSKKDQAEIYIKSSTMYQNDSSSSSTTEATQAYMQFAQDARKSAYLNTYVNNGGDFSALTDVRPQPLS